MADGSKQSSLDDLRREVGRICDGGGSFQDITQGTDYRAFAPAPPDGRLRPMGRVEAPFERGPFGRWLVQQVEREGLIGELVKAAKADPRFPKEGDPEAVRKRLREVMADGDMFEAVDEAEMDWQTA